ncbi:branched-subunit amino acid transport protein AzlD [Roseibium hamelinense]|uniref:Branched-subunit amino acid transport protein AzlD n=1 Tax=Roseibium hamelinense TaxID=150831 RepID=A0A562SF62_9HYPH|nr:AzlD domain-containing protein [Roseibium hamelinense]MTI44201.1 AzlD domain-containing protein [Roseibium hamelinense]TWI80015.1 branched-subunit amino acid transport protein AzlD [Roseibium hamelinense]
MSGADFAGAWWWPYVMILVAGWLATDIWRWLGVFAGGRLREDGEFLIWVRCVATALVAGVISKLILFPQGVLETTPVWLRISAAAFGFVVFLGVRQKVVLGVLAAEVFLIGGWLVLGS